jgi:hypothetical protein
MPQITASTARRAPQNSFATHSPRKRTNRDIAERLFRAKSRHGAIDLWYLMISPGQPWFS